MRQHIFLPPLKNNTAQKKKEKIKRMLFGTVIFAHIDEYVLIMVCDINACYLFFSIMLLLVSGEKKWTWSVKLIRISLFLLTSAFVNKIIWVFLKLQKHSFIFCSKLGILLLKTGSTEYVLKESSINCLLVLKLILLELAHPWQWWSHNSQGI